MSRRPDGRHLIQLTVLPDLYERIQQHCRALDKPVTVWARDLMRRELEHAQPTEPSR